MFSQNDYTTIEDSTYEKVIDDFFESLQWDKIDMDPIADDIGFGDLMKVVDFENRWAYKGSLNVPPCTKYVYWNVLTTIYPIKAKHIE